MGVDISNDFTGADPSRVAHLRDAPGWEEPEGKRKLVLTPASAIQPRRVKWMWDGRIALGTIALLAGREGVGKSTLAYWIAARVTKGELPGERSSQPRAVLVCATEDSWAHTIVPRLIAAGADLAQVYRVEVVSDLVHVGLALPRDGVEVERVATETGAGLLLLDPLMSRLDASLDSHRDHEVRLALEPLAALADRAGLAVIGLIHHNKSGSSDPLQLVMGSKAFTAVARSVSTVIPDPDDDDDGGGRRRLFGTPKNNLGRTDLPTLSFTVESHPVDTDEGTAWTGRIKWGDESSVSIAEAMRRAATDDREVSGAVAECKGWLEDYLSSKGGSEESAKIKGAAKSAGHTDRALRSARDRLQLVVESIGFPRVTVWTLPDTIASRDASRDISPRGEVTTDMTDTTRGEGPSRDSRDGRDTTPRARVTTVPCGHKLTSPVERSRGTCGPCDLSNRRAS